MNNHVASQKIYCLTFKKSNASQILELSFDENKLQKIISDIEEYNKLFLDAYNSLENDCSDEQVRKFNSLKENHPLLKYMTFDYLFDTVCYADNLLSIQQHINISTHELI